MSDGTDSTNLFLAKLSEGLGPIDLAAPRVRTPPRPDPLDELGIHGDARIDDAERLRRIRRSFDLPACYKSALDLRDVWTGETLCIVGSATSLESTLPELVDLVAAGAKVMAINKTHDKLLDYGLVPTFGLTAEASDFAAGYMTPTLGVKYLLASQCHDTTLARFKNWPEVYLWHAWGETSDREVMVEEARRTNKRAFGVEGGSTSTLRGMWIAPLLMAFRELHFFAVDSSADPSTGKLHPFDKPILDPVNIPFKLNDPKDGRELNRLYWTSKAMFHQVRQFEILLTRARHGIVAGAFPPVRIAVHGAGLLPDWAALRGLHIDPTRGDMLRAEPPQEHEVPSWLQQPLFNAPQIQPILSAEPLPSVVISETLLSAT